MKFKKGEPDLLDPGCSVEVVLADYQVMDEKASRPVREKDSVHQFNRVIFFGEGISTMNSFNKGVK